MDILEFVLSQILQGLQFLRDTDIFGLSIFDWIVGLSVGSFVLDIFIGGGDGSAD